MSIKILLADDHTIVRQGLRALIESESDLLVLGEASNGLETLEKTHSLDPDVVVLDLALPDIHGLEITRQIHNRDPRVRIVILSMHAKEAYVVEAINNGASSYVLKGSEANDLIQAIRLAVQGIRYLSPPLSEESLEEYIFKTKDNTLDLLETLTNREHQILHLAASGCSNNEIARRLTISPRTVEVHRAKMMSKLGLRNQSDLIRFAIQRGIVALDDRLE
jgi:DNA-binding NarL/FixJ family response regulator